MITIIFLRFHLLWNKNLTHINFGNYLLHWCLWTLLSSFPHIQNCNFNLVSVLTNVATEGVAEQSSTFSPIYEAHHAIDGNLLTDVFDNASRAQCAITKKTEDESWWRVDFMKTTAVIGVIITTRKNWGKINSFGFPLNLINSTKL